MSTRVLAPLDTTVNHRVHQARNKLITNIKKEMSKEILIQRILHPQHNEETTDNQETTGPILNPSNAQIQATLDKVETYITNKITSHTTTTSKSPLLDNFVHGVNLAVKTQRNLASLQFLLKQLKNAEQQLKNAEHENVTGEKNTNKQHRTETQMSILYRDETIIPSNAIPDNQSQLYHWEVKSTGQPWFTIEEKTVAPEMNEGFVRLVYNGNSHSNVGNSYSNVIDIRTVIRRQVHDAKRIPHRFSASNSEFQQRCYGVARRIAGLYTPQASLSTGLSMQVFRDRVRRLPAHMKMDLQDILNLCRHRFSSNKTEEDSTFVRMVEFCEPTIRLNPLALTRTLKQIYSGKKITLSMEHSDGTNQNSNIEDDQSAEGDYLSIEELSEFTDENNERPGEQKPTEDDLKQIKSAFKIYDTDNNSKISFSEFLEKTNLDKKAIAEMIEKHDIDNDRRISYDEFLKWCIDTEAVKYWTNIKVNNNDSEMQGPPRNRNSIAPTVTIQDLVRPVRPTVTIQDLKKKNAEDEVNYINNNANAATDDDADMTEEDESSENRANAATDDDADMTEEDESSENSATAAPVQTMRVYDSETEGTSAVKVGHYFTTTSRTFYYKESTTGSVEVSQDQAKKNGWVLKTDQHKGETNTEANNDSDEISSENSATAAATEEAKNVNERGSDKWINVLERPAERTLVKINNEVGILEYGKQHWNQLEGTDTKVNGWSNGKVRVQSTEKAKNVGSDKWINVLERPAERTLVKINNEVGILEYGKQHWNQLEGTDTKVNGWSNGKVRVQSTEKESSAEREQAAPAADNSNGEGSMYNMSSDWSTSEAAVPSGELTEMLTNMSSDWATSDDELNFAEDSANEFEEEAMAFAESSSGHDTSELVFAETSSGNDANEMVFAGSSESFSSALEFAESSDFAMTSDSDTGQ